MNHDRWRAIDEHLDQALDATPTELDILLKSVRAEDATLADDLEALLEERAAMCRERFLEDGPLPSSSAALTGQVIGAYTLVSLLGQGGMGSVWLAERSDGRFLGRVALKLLHPGILAPGAHERFKREGDILARLKHPHIAHLLDAGVAPGGQPYLVIEHVDGEQIDSFCDERTLTVGARVRLVLDMLAAVSHAHINLIVHRDLKPSNVLVSGDGRVKLLDFGIAKLLETEGAELTALTRDGSRALTPAYAAPEQLRGEAITTATDVYAVGVLLYVILTGRHPAGDAASSSVRLLEALATLETPRLAAPLRSATAAEAAKLAARRGTTPDRLERALRGDLDTIVAKALKRAPEERYESATALADDLRRYLNDEPIRARPDSLRYRTTRFVRRHRLPVGLAALTLLALIAGLTGTAWQARRAAHQRDVATAQLQRAESINAFNIFLLGDALPSGKPVSLHELLTRAERLVDKRFTNDEALAAELLTTLGRTYAAHGEDADARRVLKRAYETSLRLGDAEVRTAAACHWARMIAGEGDFAGGRRLIDTALAATPDEDRFDTVVAVCQVVKGNIAIMEGRPGLVEAAGRGALARLEGKPSMAPETRVDALHLLAVARTMQGDTGGADRLFGQAFEQMRGLGQDETTSAGFLYHNWATNLTLTSPLEALDREARVIAIFESQTPDSIPTSIRIGHAVVLNLLAHHHEARAAHEAIRAFARKQGAPLSIAVSSQGVARACRSLGDRPCARAALREAEDVLKGFPADHGLRASLLREQGLLAADEGRTDEGRRLLRAALEIGEKLATKHVAYLETLLALARLELHGGDGVQASVHARAALERANALRGNTRYSAWVGMSELALGEVAEAQGDAIAAHAHFLQAMAHLTPTLGTTHPAAIEAKSRLAGYAADAPLR